ncbi:MAG TPA: cytochrome c oxidase subunit II [Dehalococcoidia bacterium]|jgi:cytochrome c oxidase subunit 2|nr:cytochrome c oxidase subunit II [Dehalococcoidia bacterium]
MIMGGKFRIGRILPFAVIVASALFLSGCDVFSSPQNTFNPGGTVAQQQKDDFLLVMWPALVIGVIVFVGIGVIALRFRHKEGDPLPKQIHGNTALELSWTIIPILLLAVLAVPTVEGIRTLAQDPGPNALQVKVTGVQWAWLFEYPDIDAGGAPLSPPVGELRIPVGQDVRFEIHSQDVNHSFWVPKLAGKTDAIQNHVNHMWFRADEAGEFSGQCAEFCGLDHYNMRMKIIAMPKEEFDAWIADQQQQASARQPAGGAEQLVAGNGE